VEAIEWHLGCRFTLESCCDDIHIAVPYPDTKRFTAASNTFGRSAELIGETTLCNPPWSAPGRGAILGGITQWCELLGAGLTAGEKAHRPTHTVLVIPSFAPTDNPLLAASLCRSFGLAKVRPSSVEWPSCRGSPLTNTHPQANGR
jgi:hypothetical protein